MPKKTQTPPPPIAHTGSATVNGPGVEARVSWHTRGQIAEAGFTVVPELPEPDEQLASALGWALAKVVRGLADQGITVHLAADHPATELDGMAEAVARAAGLTEPRELSILRRRLPIPADDPARDGVPEVTVRPFRPGLDDDAWIRANNRAFAGHPDQGQETTETLSSRMAEPWFDPADFLVADDAGRPGELSGFCWTKVHHSTGSGPRVGEIYVIGVDPSHQGEGLGPALVLAGLDHLADLGVTTAMLYVEVDNGTARDLYDRLGFQLRRRRRVYAR